MVITICCSTRSCRRPDLRRPHSCGLPLGPPQCRERDSLRQCYRSSPLRLLLTLLLMCVGWLWSGVAQAADRIPEAQVTMTLVPDAHGRFTDAQVVERLTYDTDKDAYGA